MADDGGQMYLVGPNTLAVGSRWAMVAMRSTVTLATGRRSKLRTPVSPTSRTSLTMTATGLDRTVGMSGDGPNDIIRPTEPQQRSVRVRRPRSLARPRSSEGAGQCHCHVFSNP